MPRFCILLFLFFWFGIQLYSQNGYTVRTYSTENGMPSNGIKGLQWDEETGFLWIATEAGVVRFNGIDFKNFTKENTQQLTSERMLFLVRDYEGKIFTADQARHVFTVLKNRLVLFNQYSQKNDEPINLFLISSSGKLFEHSLYRRNKRTYSLPFDQLIQLTDTSCYLHRGNLVYYYSYSIERDVDLSQTNGGAQSFFKIGKSLFIKDAANHFFEFNANDESITSLSLKEEGGADINLQQEHTIYWENGMSNPILIIRNKAWLLNRNKNIIEAHMVSDAVPEHAFIRFAQYSNKLKLLFIGTDSKGLIVISSNKVTPLRKKEPGSKERNSYYGQIELPNGDVMTNEGHVIGSRQDVQISLPINGAFNFSVFRTDSLLWYSKLNPITKQGNLHSYDYYTRQTKIYDKLVMGGFAIVGSGGKKYITDGNGVGLLESDSLRYLHRYAKWFSKIVYDMQEVQPGILFIATCNGLLRFDTHTNRLDTIFEEKDCCVRCIWQYNGYVFFGTYGKGFFIWKDGKIRSMPLDKNKYLLYTHCFIPDEEGYCWMSTNRGLFKASLGDLMHAYEFNDQHVYYHYYGKNDGMDITEMNGGCVPCAIELKNKSLSFPTMDGLLWVEPAKAIPALSTGEIYVDEFIVDNKTINPDSIGMEDFPAKSSEIIIKLGYSAWSNKENIYIDYQLNDTLSWRPVIIENEASLHFNNLPPGNYFLRLRKLNGFGINNYTYKEIKFSIRTPWYQQWWFYIVLGATVVGIFLAIFQWRISQHERLQKKLKMQVDEKTKELQEKNEVLEKADSIKTRLISIISHDIVTPLKFVTVAGKNLLEKKKQMPEQLQHETLQEMTNTSQELQLLSTNILNWIKYQNENRRLVKEQFNVSEVVDGVFGVLTSLANQKQLLLVNDVDKQLEIVQFYEPLKILVYNLVSNAISFSDKGSIVISSKVVAGDVLISVRDEGMGMTPDQVNNILSGEFIISSANVDKRKGNGLGYLIIKDLLKMMAASLNIESKPGKGTVITVTIHSAKGR